MCIHMHVYAVLTETGRGHGNLWSSCELLTWVLGTELRSFGGVVSALIS